MRLRVGLAAAAVLGLGGALAPGSAKETVPLPLAVAAMEAVVVVGRSGGEREAPRRKRVSWRAWRSSTRLVVRSRPLWWWWCGWCGWRLASSCSSEEAAGGGGESQPVVAEERESTVSIDSTEGREERRSN